MGLVEEAVVESRKMSTSVDEIAHSIPGKTLRQQFIQGTRQYVTTVKKVFCGINGVG
jgi:hypothetical protein